jgi:prolyl oligopeptidase
VNLTPPTARRSLASTCLAAAVGVVAIVVLQACAGNGANAGAGRSEFGVPVAPGLRGYPFAASRSTTQDFFGVAVADDFTWLENAADPTTRSWVAAENAYSRRYLDSMPARAALRQRLQSLLASSTNGYASLVERGGLVFALKTAPPLQRPVLVVLKSVDDVASERVVFDPNQAAPGGALAIEFFRPSLDGRKVAVAISGGGADDAVLRVIDVASGQALPDQVSRVTSAAAGGDVAWSAGNAGFFCTQYSPAGARTSGDATGVAQVVFHRLGVAPAQDRIELSAGLPRLARLRLESARDGRNVMAIVENGRGGDVSLYLKPSDANGEGAWRRLAAEADGVRDAQFGDDDAVWVRAIGNAPRGKVLRVPLAETRSGVAWDKAAIVAVPQEGAVQRFAVAGGTLYVAEGLTGASRLRAIDVRTRRGMTVALPGTSGIAALARVGRGDVVAQVVSYLEPPLWTRVAGGRAKRTALVTTSDANFNDSEVVREFAPSRDGTPVPVDIVRRRGTRLDGRNPLLLMPAGAFGPGSTPDFDAARRVWLDRGGVVAVATLRGAPDSGEAWRVDGLRTKKQNAIDDLVAAADYLVKHGYTQPALLGLRGRGDGALAVGAALTQRPELFRAVAAAGGRYDVLRLERDPVGEYDVSELGSVKDRAQFDALAAYSPLRAVRDGAHYPAVLLLAGDRDGRVNPAQSRKMAARLQQADPSGRPILLRTDVSSGQAGPGSLAEAVDQAADETGFFLNEVVAAQ